MVVYGFRTLNNINIVVYRFRTLNNINKYEELGTISYIYIGGEWSCPPSFSRFAFRLYTSGLRVMLPAAVTQRTNDNQRSG